MNPGSVGAERLEDLVPLEALKSSRDVAPDDREKVADVQSFRGRLGEHPQGVERVGRVGHVSDVRLPLRPGLLPLLLDRRGIVTRGLFGSARVGVHRVGHRSKVASPYLTFILPCNSSCRRWVLPSL